MFFFLQTLLAKLLKPHGRVIKHETLQKTQTELVRKGNTLGPSKPRKRSEMS